MTSSSDSEVRSVSSTFNSGPMTSIPALGGLAVMAHALAVERTGYDGMFVWNDDHFETKRPGLIGKRFGRKFWKGSLPLSSTTAEYYHIIQHIERGEAP